jgi:hypothetical protein
LIVFGSFLPNSQAATIQILCHQNAFNIPGRLGNGGEAKAVQENMWWGIWSGTSLLAERFETLFVIECCVRGVADR